MGPREGTLEGTSPCARSLLLPPPHPQATWARVLGRGHPPCSAWARAALTPPRRGAEADGPQTCERGRGSLRLSSQCHPPQRLEALPSIPSPGSLFSPVELPGVGGGGGERATWLSASLLLSRSWEAPACFYIPGRRHFTPSATFCPAQERPVTPTQGGQDSRVNDGPGGLCADCGPRQRRAVAWSLSSRQNSSGN